MSYFVDQTALPPGILYVPDFRDRLVSSCVHGIRAEMSRNRSLQEKMGKRVSHSLIQISDSHLPADERTSLRGVDVGASLSSVLCGLAQSDELPDLIIHTGDLIQTEAAYDPNERSRLARAAYTRISDALSEVGRVVHCLPGNHDDQEVMTGVLARGPLSMERRLLLGGWQILMLDSSVFDSPGGHLSREELSFLEETLSGSERHTLVCMHHAPVPIGSAWLDTMTIDNAAELFMVLDRHSQVQGVLFGHIHQEFESRWGRLPLLGSPATGWQFLPGAAEPKLDPIGPAYRSLELLPDGTFTTRVHRISASDARSVAGCE